MISVNIDVTPEDLAVSIWGGCNPDEIKEIILALDDYVADYDFTKELRNEFARRIKAEDEAIKRSEVG